MTVGVHIKKYRDYYIATSPDMFGLWLCDEDRDNLEETIPAAIALLMKAEHGKEYTVTRITERE